MIRSNMVTGVPVFLAMLCLVTNSALADSKIGHDGKYNYVEAQQSEKGLMRIS